MTKAIGKDYVVVGTRSLAFLVLSLWVLLTIVGCGPSASSIAGTRWECQGPNQADKGEILEFFNDNTYKLAIMTGKWVVLDDGRIKMDISSFGVTQTFFVRIEGGRLSLDINGNKLDFVKSK